MTRVDFYIVEHDSADARLSVACRIAEKAMLADQRVYVITDSPAESERLDDLMWTFSQGSFVPHRVASDAHAEGSSEPVQIGHDAPAAVAEFDLLINLSSAVPEDYASCERVAELVDGNAARRTSGRERYRFYRDQGIEPKTHHV